MQTACPGKRQRLRRVGGPLESFKAEVAHGLGADDLLTGLADWLAVLHYLARAAE
jgi:hypothetical protein